MSNFEIAGGACRVAMLGRDAPANDPLGWSQRLFLDLLNRPADLNPFRQPNRRRIGFLMAS